MILNEPRKEERKFLAEVKKHLDIAFNLIQFSSVTTKLTESSQYQDRNESFDMLYQINDKSYEVSIRYRNFEYLKYQDLTIRSKVISGYKTELDKILEGKGQFYFYAYKNQGNDRLIEVYLVDMNIIRSLYADGKYQTRYNKNINDQLVAFSFADIKNEGGEIYHFCE